MAFERPAGSEGRNHRRRPAALAEGQLDPGLDHDPKEGAALGGPAGSFVGAAFTSETGFWGAVPGGIAGATLGCGLFLMDDSQPDGNP